jgi:fumarate hydratase class I
VVTGRDRLHKFLHDGGKPPVDLRDGAVYHCGPVAVPRDGAWSIRAAGPTTSLREEPYMASILERFGVRVIMGKGGMGEATREACARCGAVYLSIVGGTACTVAAHIEAVEGVHMLKTFGSAEAMWELRVRDLEAMVTMDSAGNSLHARVRQRSRRALRKLLAGPSSGAAQKGG